MLIRVGRYSKAIGTVTPFNLTCPQCGKINTLTIQWYQQFGHALGYPILPWGKLFTITCLACHSTWNKKTVPASIAEQVMTTKKQVRGPWYTYLGLILTTIILAGGIGGIINERRNNALYLAYPKITDTYIVAENKQFTVWQLVDIATDTQSFLISNYLYDSGLAAEKADADKEGFFSGEIITKTKTELDTMLKKHTILQIKRIIPDTTP